MSTSLVQVIATTFDGTQAAIEAAVPIAKGTRARLTVVVPRIVPFALPDGPPHDLTDVAADCYRRQIYDLESDGRVQICLCRTVDDVVGNLISADATIVIGGPSGRWWMSPEERFANRLSRDGFRIIYVATGQNRSRRRIALGTAATFAILLACRPVLSAQTAPSIQYGAFLDTAFSNSFNDPPNHLFRNRGTTPRVDELDLNMAGAYVRKIPSESSRVGGEATVQGGEDSKLFGFSATAPNITGADWLRHLGPTNASYIVPAGRGVTVQGGIFSSLIGYDSLYAKDNINYTRPWGADYTPYLMLGVNAAYPVTDRVTLTGVVVNGYWHLAHANDVPSFGGQLAYKPNDRVTVKQTVLYGPHQANTSLEFWRLFSDSIVERRSDRLTTAFEVQVGEEEVDAASRVRAWWIAAQAPVRWRVRGPWSVAVRPEFCRDTEGRWTGFEQTVAAVTTTVEYKLPIQKAAATLRAEYRYDNSTGPGGGFFSETGGLVSGQQLLIGAAILTYDGFR